MRKPGKKKLLAAISSVICISSAAILIPKAVPVNARHAEDRSPETKELRLNDTLTNAMSGFQGDDSMDRTIEAFMQKWGIKGASLAIMRNDSLLFAKGYGWADEEKGDSMTPRNILRMASVSKLITATGIMVLKERDIDQNTKEASAVHI